MAFLRPTFSFGTPASVSDLVVQTRSATGVLITLVEGTLVFFEEVFQQ
jgi:hypothetical protein